MHNTARTQAQTSSKPMTKDEANKYAKSQIEAHKGRECFPLDHMNPHDFNLVVRAFADHGCGIAWDELNNKAIITPKARKSIWHHEHAEGDAV